jgi:hypothetical protein
MIVFSYNLASEGVPHAALQDCCGIAYMHHSLRFYGRYQRSFLRFYISLARLTNIPLLGRLLRWVANMYGRRGHGGYLLTLKQAEQIIDASPNVGLGPCSCRQVFHNCDAPIMAEIVIGAGAEVFPEIKPGEFHEVSKEEAKEVLHQCHQQRMVHTITRCRDGFYAICNCCACCCVPTRLRQNYRIEYALVKNKDIVSNFQQLCLSPSTTTDSR